MSVTYQQLLDRVISDGLTEVRVVYADPADHHKRDGAIAGFEACREKLPDQILALWREVAHEDAQHDDVTAYWRRRYKALQIEWVLNVLSVGLQALGKPALLAHLPTARAVMKYVEVVGLRDEDEDLSQEDLS